MLNHDDSRRRSKGSAVLTPRSQVQDVMDPMGSYVVLGLSLLQVPVLVGGRVSVNETKTRPRSNGIKYCVFLTRREDTSTSTTETHWTQHEVVSRSDCHVLNAICLKNDLLSITTGSALGLTKNTRVTKNPQESISHNVNQIKERTQPTF